MQRRRWSAVWRRRGFRRGPVPSRPPARLPAAGQFGKVRKRVAVLDRHHALAGRRVNLAGGDHHRAINNLEVPVAVGLRLAIGGDGAAAARKTHVGRGVKALAPRTADRPAIGESIGQVLFLPFPDERAGDAVTRPDGCPVVVEDLAPGVLDAANLGIDGGNLGPVAVGDHGLDVGHGRIMVVVKVALGVLIEVLLGDEGQAAWDHGPSCSRTRPDY